MKLQKQVEINVSAKATYRDGEVNLILTGQSPYGESSKVGVRLAQGVVESGFSDKVLAKFEDAFQLAISENQERLLAQSDVAKSVALTAASRLGEV